MTEPTATLALPGGCPPVVFAERARCRLLRRRLRHRPARSVSHASRSALTAPELASLLHDLEANVRVGHRHAAEAMRWVRRGATSHSRAVVEAAVGLVEFADNTLVDDASRPAFGRIVRRVFGARARALGFAPRPGESDDDQLLRRSLLWLVAPVDPALSADARRLARRLDRRPHGGRSRHGRRRADHRRAIGATPRCSTRCVPRRRPPRTASSGAQLIIGAGLVRGSRACQRAACRCCSTRPSTCANRGPRSCTRATGCRAATRRYDFIMQNFDALARRGRSRPAGRLARLRRRTLLGRRCRRRLPRSGRRAPTAIRVPRASSRRRSNRSVPANRCASAPDRRISMVDSCKGFVT